MVAVKAGVSSPVTLAESNLKEVCVFSDSPSFQEVSWELQQLASHSALTIKSTEK